jgi:hypothetical protein
VELCIGKEGMAHLGLDERTCKTSAQYRLGCIRLRPQYSMTSEVVGVPLVYVVLRVMRSLAGQWRATAKTPGGYGGEPCTAD